MWNFLRWGLVLAIIILSAMNASWIAPQPPGVLRLIDGSQGACPDRAAVQKAFSDGADFLVLFSQPNAECTFDMRYFPNRKFMAAGEAGAFTTEHPVPWRWTLAGARACYGDYFIQGWMGIVPESCRGKTMVVPLEGQLKLWGWPKRFMARMNAAGVKVILGEPGKGVSRPNQLPNVPRDFTGYLWVDDIAKIGPAIRG